MGRCGRHRLLPTAERRPRRLPIIPSAALRFRRNADFWRISEEWGDEHCIEHVTCIKLDGSTWLHLAIEHCDSSRGDISIVEAILDWGVPLKAKNIFLIFTQITAITASLGVL